MKKIKGLLLGLLMVASMGFAQSWTPAGSQNMGYTGGDLEVTGDLDVKGSLRAYPSELELMHRAAAAFSWVKPDDSPLASGTITLGPTHGKGSKAFSNAVLMPNGRVFLCSYEASAFGEYDPVNNTYKDLISHGKTGQYFQWAVYAGKNKILIVGYDHSSDMCIYDIKNNSIEWILNNGDISEPVALLALGHGKVMFVNQSYSSRYQGVYIVDIDKKSYSLATLHGKGRYAYSGAVQLLDGRVCLVPSRSSCIGIFNPVKGTYTDGAQTGITGVDGVQFQKGVLLPDGRVLLAPRKHDKIGIYDPILDVYEDGAERGEHIMGAVVLENAKVAMLPYSTGVGGLYDPKTNEYADDVSYYSGSFGFISGGILLPNGSIFIPSFNRTSFTLYTPANSKQIPIFPLLSPFIQ